MFKKETPPEQAGENGIVKTPKSRKTSEETESLIEGFGNYMGSMDKRDGFISARLTSLVPSAKNGRIGQAALLESLPIIIGIIKELANKGETSIPDLADLMLQPGFPKIPQASLMLLKSCIELANSFIENGGYADTPPKVYPAVNGQHQMKIGHRRYISYLLAEPMTGVSSIDVIIDKGSNTQDDQLGQGISRTTENSARVPNSLAEQIYEMKAVYDLTMDKTGDRPNITHLSKTTNIERTKLSRIIDMISNGAGDDIELLSRIHENQIEDAVSLALLFQQPRETWSVALDQLVALGPTEFREKIRALKEEKEGALVEEQSHGKEKRPRKPKPLIEKKYAPSLEKIIGLVEEHKSEWFEGVDPSASAEEKLKWILEKLTNEKA